MIQLLFKRTHDLLVRETSGGQLIPHIDGLRFFAIVSVLLFHLNGYVTEKISHAMGITPEQIIADPTWRVLGSGYFGVRLFFVISGFILGMPFAKAWLTGKPRPELGKYFIRRVTRLEPPYIICMCVIAVLLVVTKGQPITLIMQHLGASLLYGHYFIYGTPSLINGVTWSLEIEVQFYILAPLFGCIFAISNKWARRALLCAGIIGFALGQRYAQVDGEHGYTLLHEAHYFLCGFLLVDFQLTDWAKSKPTASAAMVWDVVGLGAWVLMTLLLAFWTPLFSRPGLQEMYPRHDQLAHLPLAALIVVAYAAAFRGRFWMAFFSHPILYIVGGMCYTIYLWHSLLVSFAGIGAVKLVHTQSHAMNVLLSAVIVVPVVLVVCSVLFVLFEKPFMRRDWVERTMGFLGMGKKAAA